MCTQEQSKLPRHHKTQTAALFRGMMSWWPARLALQMLKQSILANTIINNSVMSALSKEGLWQDSRKNPKLNGWSEVHRFTIALQIWCETGARQNLLLPPQQKNLFAVCMILHAFFMFLKSMTVFLCWNTPRRSAHALMKNLDFQFHVGSIDDPSRDARCRMSWQWPWCWMLRALLQHCWSFPNASSSLSPYSVEYLITGISIRFVAAGCCDTLTVKVTTYNSAIAACERAWQWTAALQLFVQMRKDTPIHHGQFACWWFAPEIYYYNYHYYCYYYCCYGTIITVIYKSKHSDSAFVLLGVGNPWIQ